MLEAMRLCRRKAWLVTVSEHLDKAEKIWPPWLPKNWLPYFRAGLLLREGKMDAFASARTEIRLQNASSDSRRSELTDALMMLGAAQLMRVPAADLKPLREPVDEAAKNAKRLDNAELIDAGSFFWDMHRVNLIYPAYRMHAPKFHAELLGRFKAIRKGDFKTPIKTRQFRDAIYWLVERRAFADGYEFKPVPALRPLLSEVSDAAVVVGSLLKVRQFSRFRLRDHRPEIAMLRETARTEQDPYYRFWFANLADRAEVEVAASAAKTSLLDGFDPFSWMSGDEEDDDEDDDEEDEEDDCDCPSCRARRGEAAYDTPKVNDNTRRFEPIVPPMPSMPRIKQPVDLDYKRSRPKDPMGKKNKR